MQQASSRKVQFWFPDKSAWERADRKAISGPKLRKELSRKRKERKRQKKVARVETDAFRNFAKAKGVACCSEALRNVFAAMFWIRGTNTVASLTTMFVERLDLNAHPELKVDAQGRDWPGLFRTLRVALEQNWRAQWTEHQQQHKLTAPTGAEPLPDVVHPVYSEGDNLLHKLFLIPDLGSFIEEKKRNFWEFSQTRLRGRSHPFGSKGALSAWHDVRVGREYRP